MRKIIALLVLISVLLAAAGCGSENVTSDNNMPKVFYLQNGTNKLTSIPFKSEKSIDNPEEFVLDIFYKMKNVPDVTYRTAVPKNLMIQEETLSESSLTLYFGPEYYDMTAQEEILFRAALVKSLTSNKEITDVGFYVNKNPLVSSTGETVGRMNAQSFLDDSLEEAMNIIWHEATIYYSNKAGDRLIERKMMVSYNQSKSLEEVVMKKLLTSPNESFCRKTIPDEVSLLEVYVKDGICFVNFSKNFLDALYDVSADVTFFSIVNTLCELPSVKGVQILIEGSSSGTFHDKYNLSAVYERNLDIVL